MLTTGPFCAHNRAILQQGHSVLTTGPFCAHNRAILCPQQGHSVLTTGPFCAHNRAILCSQQGHSVLTGPFCAYRRAILFSQLGHSVLTNTCKKHHQTGCMTFDQRSHKLNTKNERPCTHRHTHTDTHTRAHTGIHNHCKLTHEVLISKTRNMSSTSKCRSNMACIALKFNVLSLIAR